MICHSDMKKFLKICCSVALMAISTACHDGIWEELHNQNQRLEALEAMCAEMNSNVQALKTLVESMGEKDYVTNVNRH